MRRTTVMAAGAATIALALSACGTGGSGGEPVSGGTWVAAISSDPGSLIPMTATAPATWSVINYAYESLVHLTGDGEIVPWIAEEWEQTGTEIVYTLRDDVSCSDGEPFTAETAAANINFHADPANGTFYYGSQVTEAVSASADGNVLTITSEVNDPFLLENTGAILLVCQNGLDDPESLADTTAGTGLFVLSGVEPQSSYTFVKRDDYTWGPRGVTSETAGLPDALEIRVIPDESTAANLLLDGSINAALVLGADRARLDAAGLDFVGTRNPIGEILFNERPDRVTSDPLVREALVTALDRDEVGTVVTDGTAVPALSLVNQSPMVCVPETPAWSLPETSLERAGELLDEAGWTLGADGLREKDGEKLTVKFIYDAGTAPHGAAAELVQQTWNELGVTTELSANDDTKWSEQLWSTFDWDLGWVQIAPSTPVVLSLFFDGATPDQGGYNFMFVDNPEYKALAAQARTASPEEACGLWLDAERELIERFDAFPLTDALIRTYMAGSEFELPGFISPTTIRMLG